MGSFASFEDFSCPFPEVGFAVGCDVVTAAAASLPVVVVEAVAPLPVPLLVVCDFAASVAALDFAVGEGNSEAAVDAGVALVPS